MTRIRERHRKKIQVTAKFSLYLKNVFVFEHWGPQSLSSKPFRKRDTCNAMSKRFSNAE